MDSARKLSAKISSVVSKKLSGGSKIRYHRLPGEKQKQKQKRQKVPPGCVPIYVGEEGAERKQYNVPIKFLRFPCLQELINKGDDIELKIDGPITLSCPTSYFHQLLKDAKTFVKNTEF